MKLQCSKDEKTKLNHANKIGLLFLSCVKPNFVQTHSESSTNSITIMERTSDIVERCSMLQWRSCEGISYLLEMHALIR